MNDKMNNIRPMPDHNQWPVFSIPGNDVSPAQTDLSYLLEKPAGATGVVRIIDGHLASGDGRRLRLWGYNFTARANLPSFERAPLIARHLAKYGVNCLRLHFMDLRWPAGLIMRSLRPKKESAPEDILVGD